ncbi:hypothetical protein T265_10039 [Opisthorchis viverrini]|uniref:Uncharacterized protein n=1 Tax=Opisthorchis viverrini TaxID=6198 RepID=A0A074Z3P8_OPIVI|nr:hypothetical protein T265_10039 [Opisthorchis viverrini]KER21691.1 hypothetical protein T265_10039 [Opisthorchis viverrini]
MLADGANKINSPCVKQMFIGGGNGKERRSPTDSDQLKTERTKSPPVSAGFSVVGRLNDLARGRTNQLGWLHTFVCVRNARSCMEMHFPTACTSLCRVLYKQRKAHIESCHLSRRNPRVSVNRERHKLEIQLSPSVNLLCGLDSGFLCPQTTQNEEIDDMKSEPHLSYFCGSHQSEDLIEEQHTPSSESIRPWDDSSNTFVSYSALNLYTPNHSTSDPVQSPKLHKSSRYTACDYLGHDPTLTSVRIFVHCLVALEPLHVRNGGFSLRPYRANTMNLFYLGYQRNSNNQREHNYLVVCMIQVTVPKRLNGKQPSSRYLKELQMKLLLYWRSPILTCLLDQQRRREVDCIHHKSYAEPARGDSAVWRRPWPQLSVEDGWICNRLASVHTLTQLVGERQEQNRPGKLGKKPRSCVSIRESENPFARFNRMMHCSDVIEFEEYAISIRTSDQGY